MILLREVEGMSYTNQRRYRVLAPRGLLSRLQYALPPRNILNDVSGTEATFMANAVKLA